MGDYIQSNSIIEERISIKGIPAILFRQKEENESIPTIIFYHGWSSKKESQRIRGFLLAAVGYQVIIPDAINHGERNPLNDYEKVENVVKYLWDTIFTNLEEGDIIVEELISKYNTDPNRIGVMGHSMGGMTTAGLFTHNPKIKTAIVLNGSCAWEDLNNRFKERLDMDIETKELDNTINEIDPMSNL